MNTSNMILNLLFSASIKIWASNSNANVLQHKFSEELNCVQQNLISRSEVTPGTSSNKKRARMMREVNCGLIMCELELGDLWVTVLSKCLAHVPPTSGIQLDNLRARRGACFCTAGLPRGRCAHKHGHRLWRRAGTHTPEPHPSSHTREHEYTCSSPLQSSSHQNLPPPQWFPF